MQQPKAPQKIVVLNTKGGSGKTTVATNLAAYYAWRGSRVALMDLDPQVRTPQTPKPGDANRRA